MTAATLPPELLGIIFSGLVTEVESTGDWPLPSLDPRPFVPDIPSLKSCSLVSRQWRGPAQACLFRTLSFTRASDRDDREEHEQPDILAFLSSAPHLCSATRALQLSARHTRDGRAFSAPAQHTLSAVLAAFPHLRTVSLTGSLGLLLDAHATLGADPPRLPWRLQRLALAGTHRAVASCALQPVLDLLGRCGAVDALVLDFMTAPGGLALAPRAVRPRWRAAALTLGGAVSIDFVKAFFAFCDTSHPDRLTQLRFKSPVGEGFPGRLTKEFMEWLNGDAGGGVVSGITHLTLPLPFSDVTPGGERYVVPLDLTSFTTLQRLSVSVRPRKLLGASLGARVALSLAAFARIPRLHTLELALCFPPFECAAQGDAKLKDLRDTLSHLDPVLLDAVARGRVQVVAVGLCCGERRLEYADVLKTLLPALHERGCLRV